MIRKDKLWAVMSDAGHGHIVALNNGDKIYDNNKSSSQGSRKVKKKGG